MVVEKNGEIVFKSVYVDIVISVDDKIEIVVVVGGGWVEIVFVVK